MQELHEFMLPQRTNNRLLDALSPEGRSALLRRARPTTLPLGSVLFEAHEPPCYGYFLTSGIASTVTNTRSGDSAEVGLAGCEGLIGSLYLLGPASVPAQSIVQVDATALCVPFAELKSIFCSSEEFRTRVLEFVQSESLTTIQIAGCHRLHATEQRLSRWLLMVQDRVETDELKLTHSFLALMLGIRRPTVTLVARSFQERGMLELHRGSVRILDRGRLEAMACDCYKNTQQLYRELYSKAAG